jgi:hypothetical protein
MAEFKIGRDSKTGRFIKVAVAKSDPSHTSVETIKNTKK